jgi:hypothetical protein
VRAAAAPHATLRRQAGAEWLEIQVGLAWLQSYRPRQLGPSPELTLAARTPIGHGPNWPNWPNWLRRLTLGVDGLIPVSTPRVSSGGGTTTFEAYRFGLSLALAIPIEASRFSLQTALGVGAFYVRKRSSIDNPLVGLASDLHDWAGTAALSAGPSVALTPFLLVQLDLAAGISFPRIGAWHGPINDPTRAEEVGGLGPVYGLASLGLQAAW